MVNQDKFDILKAAKHVHVLNQRLKELRPAVNASIWLCEIPQVREWKRLYKERMGIFDEAVDAGYPHYVLLGMVKDLD